MFFFQVSFCFRSRKLLCMYFTMHKNFAHFLLDMLLSLSEKACKSDCNILLKISEKELIIIQMINAVWKEGIAVIARQDVGNAKSSARPIQICAGKLRKLLLYLARVFGKASTFVKALVGGSGVGHPVERI